MREPGSQGAPERALAAARLVAAMMALAPVLLFVVAHAVRREPTLSSLAPAAAVAGLLVPMVGYRLYHGLRGRIPPEADVPAKSAAFLRATLLALAVSDGVATFGGVAYFLARDPVTYLCLATHLILTGAVWPSPSRLEHFLEENGNRHGVTH